MNRLVCKLILCGSLIFYSGFAVINAETKPVATENDSIVIKGVVYDELTNAPIPNLGIYKDTDSHKVTVTNKKGEFRYPVKAGDKEIQILPYSDKIVGKSIFINPAEFKGRVIKIYAERGMKLNVQVKDEAGHPIEKANVLWMCAGGCGGKTDKTGRVVIGMVSRFRNGCISVSAPGYDSWSNGDVYAPLYANGGLTVTLKKTVKDN